MKGKIACLTIIALFLLVIPAFAQEGQTCNENEKCDSIVQNGVCIGKCIPVDQDTCSALSFSLECIIGKTIDKWKGKLESIVNEAVVSFLDFGVDTKGNEKLWNFSYSLSFLIATLLLIVTTISYFKEALKDNSNVEIVNSIKSQLFKLFFMFIFLVGSVAIISLVLEGFDVLNKEILSVLDFSPGQDLVSLLFTSLAILLPIIYFTLGLALAAFIMIFVAFFIVASLRILILYLLLSIIPIAIVLYFFDSTKRIGATIMRLAFSHLIILTVWILVFAVAGDIGRGSLTGPFLKGFFIIAAFLINTMLYFKINAFFASLAEQTTTGAERVVERITTKERVNVIKEKTFGKSVAKGQTRLIHYR